MKALMRGAKVAALAGLVAAVAGCGGGGSENPPGTVIPTGIVAPAALPGPYPVACSNVAQDFTRMAPGENAQDYWEGLPGGGPSARYASALIADPADALAATVTTSDDGSLYGRFAGKDVAFTVLTCYPTTTTNARPDYALPTGRVVPRMQTGADAPILPDAAARYPVLLFSHGYGGSPLSGDYLTAISWFASHGYVVVAPFHGDPRFSDLRVEDISDAIKILSNLRDFVALQTLRPRSLSASLDLMLAHPQWRDHLDPAQVGGFGGSMGGESLMLLGGAGLTTSAGLAWTTLPVEPRLKAAVGYVPYFGEPLLPAFGRDQHGLDNVTLPYLAISGTSDTTAPLAMTEQGIRQLKGNRELVSLQGVRHGFDEASTDDIFTWSLTFLDANVRGLTSARQQLATMASVKGGGDDRVVVPWNGPAGP